MLCCSAQIFDLYIMLLCLKSDCCIRVYSFVSKTYLIMVSVLLEYIKYQVHNKSGECSIRVITNMVSVLLEYIDLY